MDHPWEQPTEHAGCAGVGLEIVAWNDDGSESEQVPHGTFTEDCWVTKRLGNRRLELRLLPARPRSRLGRPFHRSGRSQVLRAPGASPSRNRPRGTLSSKCHRPTQRPPVLTRTGGVVGVSDTIDVSLQRVNPSPINVTTMVSPLATVTDRGPSAVRRTFRCRDLRGAAPAKVAEVRRTMASPTVNSSPSLPAVFCGMGIFPTRSAVHQHGRTNSV